MSPSWVLFLIVLSWKHADTSTLGKNITCRDRRLWPFDSSSPWNMPIGSDAQFVNASIFSGKGKYEYPIRVWIETDYWYIVNKSTPYYPFYNQSTWGGAKNPDHCNVTGNLVGYLQFPPNATTYTTGNNGAAVLMSDNVTLVQMMPLYRCQPEGPILAEFGVQKHKMCPF